MFCPPGYIDWYEMRTLTREWATRIYLADALETLKENPQEALAEDLAVNSKILELSEHQHARTRLNLKDRHFDIELISFWLMTHVCEQFEPALCSPVGNLLRAPEPIFFHPDQFFYVDLRFPLREMVELFAIYTEHDAKRMSGSDLGDRFCCIDDATGTIKQKNHTMPHFTRYYGGYPDYDSDGGVFDRFVKPFLGWSIVWDPESFPETYFEIFSALGILNKNWKNHDESASMQASAKKRGTKPNAAKREFNKRYPDGLPEELSAESVSYELKEAGFPVTGRTVQNYDNERKNRK